MSTIKRNQSNVFLWAVTDTISLYSSNIFLIKFIYLSIFFLIFRSSLYKQWRWRPRIKSREITRWIALIAMNEEIFLWKCKYYGKRELCNFNKRKKLTSLCPFLLNFAKTPLSQRSFSKTVTNTSFCNQNARLNCVPKQKKH